MATQPLRITLLPEDVRAQISSSADIVSYEQVVEGLLRNSLDARARSIIIEGDLVKGYFSVRDNGNGIEEREFSEMGHLAQLHHTSKFDSPTLTYGQHGTFLYGLSYLSLLSITSRHHLESHASRLIIHRGKIVRRQLRLQDEDTEFAGPGTSVSVHNTFGDMPVRVKQSALRYSSPSEIDKEFSQMRNMIVGYLLAQPSRLDLRFSLRTRKEHNFHCHTIVLPDTHFSLESTVSTLFQAKLLNTPETATWKLASVRTSDFFIRGTISTQPSPSRANQFISIGHVPIPRYEGSDWLYSSINDVFDSSSFGVLRESQESNNDIGTQETVFGRFPDMSKKGKGVDRWPMFSFRIKDNSNEVLRTLGQHGPSDEVRPTVTRLTKALGSLVSHFLQTAGFTVGTRTKEVARPQPTAGSGNKACVAEHSARPPRGVRPKSAVDTRHLNQWHRVKGLARSDEDFRYGLGLSKPSRKPESPPPAARQTPICDNVGGRSGIADGHPDHALPVLRAQVRGQNSGDADDSGGVPFIPWTDPRNGRTVLINSRTGAIALDSAKTRVSPERACSDAIGSDFRHLLRLNWLQRCEDNLTQFTVRSLKYKHSHCFEGSECPIPSVASVSEGIPPICGPSKVVAPRDVADSSTQNVTRDALSCARVIGQVDHKFIVATLPALSRGQDSAQNTLLILVDQHAADERVKFERLCQALFICRSTRLDKPLVFEIEESEVSRFEDRRQYFQKWHFDYQVQRSCHPGHPARPNAGEECPWSVEVSALPTLIAERCRAEPKHLVDLLRGEIWSDRLHGQSVALTPQGQDASAQQKQCWLWEIAHCPAGLLELLKSRSCRSAIMFNDHLDREQCRNLVHGLSDCAFPFQCAHGRPTLTVLAELGQVNKGSVGTTREEQLTHDDGSFSRAWERWQSS